MQVKDIAREDDGEQQEIVLTVVASPEEVKAATDEFFKQVGQREIPGFRKGKAPRTVLEQQVGGHANAMGGVAEVLINQNAFEAIDGADVIFLDEPQFNVADMPEEGAPFTFTVSGPVAPKMELTSYDPVSIEMPPSEPTEAEVGSQIQELREHYHTYRDIEDADHAAADGDYAMLTMTIVDADGKVVPGLRNTSRLIGLGAGTMPAAFDEHIIGSKAGDTLEFDFEAVDDEGNAPLGEGKLHAIVEVKSFREYVLPALDDAFAEKVGAKDVEDMRNQLRQAIHMQKTQELPTLKVDRAIEAALERLDGEVPAYFSDFLRQDVGREFMQNLQDQGTNLQQWMLQNSVDGDAMKEDIEREAQRRAAIDCMLEAVFAHNGWTVTDEDIDALFEGEKDPQATRASWEKAHRMADVRKMARRSKAAEWLADTATVTIVE
ncbi:trigger factor [Adlercreutzia murintestinalis]|uniref:trigger factor n=1 Tax=Adlercreutzia murintestinalis TaxID=2941325 RepID=UPI00203BB2E2|nr:trigger factor [Adlercreutzia murintestinalis]